MPSDIPVMPSEGVILGEVSSFTPESFRIHDFDHSARLFFFISVMRNAFVLLILTLAAFLYTRHRKSKSGKYPIKILQTVPSGLKEVHQPHIDRKLLTALAGKLPLMTIIMVLEHIAISKCKYTYILGWSSSQSHLAFGRLNNYKIVPSQELVAIGAANT